MILAVTAASLFLTGCSRFQPEPEIVTVTQVERITIPLAARPKPLQLVDTRIYVVNADNLESFIEEFTQENGELAMVAISIKDYENLALNVAELRRFINQQTEIIVYYEESINAQTTPPKANSQTNQTN